MRGRTSSIKIELTSEQREVLSGWLRRQKTPGGLAKRARAMLLLADGLSFTQTSLIVGMGERHLRKWARRFMGCDLNLMGLGGDREAVLVELLPELTPASRC